ncbi:MAG: DEAD/DEAH box helicase [Burkholderiaceae bacterium]
MPSFADFRLAEPIARAVSEMGYTIPTPIQAKAIPVVMAGVDVMGAAQTGTGKTAGFALPILQRLLRHENGSASPARHPVRALILAPTRELADQIHVNVRAYAKHTKLREAVVFGGVDIKPQIKALREGVEVLTATPGRLLDHVEQKTLQLGLVEVLVLDEADRMLDMGFLPDIQRIIQLLPKRRQNLMFSATFSGEIRKLANSFLNSPTLIEVARPNAAAENVEQRIFMVAGSDRKRAAVAQLIRDKGISQVIVFTNTKIGASRLARELTRDGLAADAIHGDKSQQDRLSTLDAFKKGEVKILVATDVAARGLDIAELPAVINFDLPYSPEDYIHRIGRTGRAGASGLALSLMTSNDERLRAEIAKLIKRDLPPETLEVVGETGEVRRESRRDERDSDRPRGRGRPESGRRRSPPKPSLPADPLFSQPYEEPDVSAVSELDAELAGRGQGGTLGPASLTGVRRRRGPVPALLGGLKRAG